MLASKLLTEFEEKIGDMEELSSRTNDREQAACNRCSSNQREDDHPQRTASALPLTNCGKSVERIGRHGGLFTVLWCLSPVDVVRVGRAATEASLATDSSS